MKIQLILATVVLASSTHAQDYARQIILQCEAQYSTANIPQSDQAKISQTQQLQQQCVQQLMAKAEPKPIWPAPFKDGRVTGKVKNRLDTQDIPSKINIPQN